MPPNMVEVLNLAGTALAVASLVIMAPLLVGVLIVWVTSWWEPR
jgi:hypothetical protein